MFGDELILEGGTLNIDNKGRIFVPAFTKVEKNDKIILEISRHNDETHLILHVYQKYFNILKRFMDLRDSATSIEEFSKYEKSIEEICSKLQGIVIVDQNKRILIPKTIMENLGWEFNKPTQYEGLGTSLSLSQKK